MAMFSMVTVIMFNFALEANLDAARNVSTGLLWATMSCWPVRWASIVRWQWNKKTKPSIRCLIAPVPRNAIYLGKVISITLFTLVH